MHLELEEKEENKMKKIILLFFIILMSFETHASLRSISLEDAWKEGKFNGRSLRNVSEIRVENEFNLTPEQKTAFLKSSNLTGLKTIELRGQDIDDTFVEAMCKKPTFSRLITIDLSDNDKITDKSVEAIIKSTIIGRIRDLPQISGRYGLPSSEVYLLVSGTRVNEQTKNKLLKKPSRFDFDIHYLNPITNKKSSASVQGAIKWVQITD